jgi:hypothetical protein
MLSEAEYRAAWDRANAEAAAHPTGMNAGARNSWANVTESILIRDLDWDAVHVNQLEYIKRGLLGQLDRVFHSDGDKTTVLGTINQRRVPVGLPPLTQDELDARIEYLIATYPIQEVAPVHPVPEPEPVEVAPAPAPQPDPVAPAVPAPSVLPEPIAQPATKRPPFFVRLWLRIRKLFG